MDDRVRMTCPSCGYSCYPQWQNDEASCLKCFAVLRRRAAGAGAGAGVEVRDHARRQPGEASTFKHGAGSALESESGDCAKSPRGVHLWRFGKCSYCAKPEPPKPQVPHKGAGANSPSSQLPARQATGLEGAARQCRKCRSPYQGHGETCAGCRRHTARRGSSKQCAECSGFFWGFGDLCDDCGGGAELSEPAEELRQRNDHTKVECPLCGYRCVPQWLNDEAHCLKCQAVLKVQATVHGAPLGKAMPFAAPRQPGEVSTFKFAPGDRMQHSSGVCDRAPGGKHVWRFGRCEHCGAAEGRVLRGAGAVGNPGGRGESCAKGGKCMFRFAKCTKCGKKEF